MAQLDDQAGPTVRFLADVARTHPGRRLCVCCYENVLAGEVCHRRWFAEWMEDCHGLVVPELAV